MQTDAPTEDDAAEAVAALAGVRPARLSRFGTGAQHFVWDVVLADGTALVARLSRRRDAALARGALVWSRRLRPLGVPLPRLLAADLSMDRLAYPALLLERLPGTDLGDVFETLTHGQRTAIGERLIAAQRRLDALPDGAGYGFVADPDGRFPHARWRNVVTADLARSRRRIRAAGVIAETRVDAVLAEVEEQTAVLDAVTPRPFLHDVTTKNVIVHEGRLSGIVDVDELCYGDPLFLVGLLRAVLAGYGLDPAYAETWLQGMGPPARRRAALYARVHAVGLLSEIGQRFNRATPVPAGTAFQARVETFLDAPTRDPLIPRAADRARPPIASP